MRGHMFESGEEIVIPNVYWTLLSIEPKTTWLFCSPLVSLAQTCEQSGQPSGLSYIKKQMHIYVFIYYRLYENLSTVDWALGFDTKGREFESGKKKRQNNNKLRQKYICTVTWQPLSFFKNRKCTVSRCELVEKVFCWPSCPDTCGSVL